MTYLEDSTGLEGNNLLRLEGIRRYIQSRGRPYVLVGDFNIPPRSPGEIRLDEGDQGRHHQASGDDDYLHIRERRDAGLRRGLHLLADRGDAEPGKVLTLEAARGAGAPHLGGPPAQEVQAAGCTEGPARHHRTGE